MPQFYYQIKGKKGPEQYYGSGISDRWVFPPIFSGKVEAKDRNEAKHIISEEYGKAFPLRILQKDLESNEFLISITDMEKSPYFDRLFELRNCEICHNRFRVIDLYNDANTKYKGDRVCSDTCHQILQNKDREKRLFDLDESMFNQAGNIPCIYRITNKTTGMCYIGQTTQAFTLRWWQHVKWGQSDCKFHEAMRGSVITDWTFEVIEVVESREQLNDREAHWIKHHQSINKGYNTVKVKEDPLKNQTTLILEEK